MSGAVPASTAGDEYYVFPCSTSQQRFWFIDQLYPESPVSNIAIHSLLTGPLRPDLIEEALNQIVERHEALRTRLVARDGHPMQLVEPRLILNVPVVDLSHLPPETRAAEADRLMSEEARRPFYLERLPLIRASLVRLEPERHILRVTLHHAISDGWSLGVLLDELAACYEAALESSPNQLPPLPLQFADYTLWEEEHLAGPKFQATLDYWRAKLQGLEPLVLPTDFPRSAVKDVSGEIASVLLPRSLTDALGHYARERGCTLYLVLLAAFQGILARWSGRNDFAIGTLVVGRQQVELEPLIGAFVNSLVLRVQLGEDPALEDIVVKASQTFFEAIEHQDMPFERLVEELRPRRGVRSHPLFQVNFITQRAFMHPLRFGGVELTPIPSKAASALYDLNLFLVERAEGWRASIEYSPSLYRKETILALLGCLSELSKAMVENPRQRLTEVLPPGLGLSQNKEAASPAPAAQHAASPASASSSSGATPLTDTEQRLQRLWRELLRTDQIDRDVNFFEAGGHSLLAVRLLARIGNEFGRSVTLAQLMAAPTIAGLAAVLDQPEPQQASPIVHLRGNGPEPPLFIIHGVGGNVIGLAALVDTLPETQPVYAIESRIGANTPTFGTLEELAGFYVDELLSLNLSSPIHLLGYSLGGMIAFEMARQLHARGVEVGLLGMLDTYLLCYWRGLTKHLTWRAKLARYKRLLQLHAHNMRERGGFFPYLRERIASRSRRIAYRAFDALGKPIPTSMLNVDHINTHVAEKYRPRPYAGSLTLFRAMKRAIQDEADYLLGWSGLAEEGIEVFDIPGDHNDMTHEPNVQVLSARLQTAIRRAMATRGVSPSV